MTSINKFNSVFLFLLLITFFPLALFSESFPTQGVITGDSVRIRDTASLKGTIADEYYRGNTLTVLSMVKGDTYKNNSNWYKVLLSPYDREGYVHSLFVLTGDAGVQYKKKLNVQVFSSYLKKYFTLAQINLILKYHQQSQKINSLKDFVQLFSLARQVQKNISPAIDTAYQKLLKSDTKNDQTGALRMAWLYNFLPGLTISYVAEGTVAELNLYFPFFQKIASQTPESSDDTFTQLYQDAYGEVEGFFGNWFLQTWDYGGKSLLGQGHHLKLLMNIDALNAKTPLFAKELMKIRSSILEDILTYQTYEEPKDIIIKEIQSILEKVKISAPEKTKLEQRIKVFESGKGLQLNCKGKECSYG